MDVVEPPLCINLGLELILESPMADISNLHE